MQRLPRFVSLFHLRLFMALALLLALPSAARAVVINNGLAPPNLANVIDHDTYTSEAVYVRNVGCPSGWPAGDPDADCPEPWGDPTEVALVDGGSVGWFGLYAYDSSSITMSGGILGGALTAYDSSTITMNGGSAGDGLLAYDSSIFTMNGGASQWMEVFDSSTATINGGWLDLLRAYGSSTVTIVGSDFAVDGIPVPYGDLGALSGLLTGTLISGDSLYTGFTRESSGTIRLVPEPTTALLVACGLVGLASKQRRAA